MSEDFEKPLAASLHGINDAFDQADYDLKSIVTELAAATASIAHRFRLGLEVIDEDRDGRIYQLALKGEQDEAKIKSAPRLVGTSRYNRRVLEGVQCINHILGF